MPDDHDEVGGRVLAALLHVEDFGLTVFRQRFFHDFDAKAAFSVIDTRHARTRHVNQSSTATRSFHPQAIS